MADSSSRCRGSSIQSGIDGFVDTDLDDAILYRLGRNDRPRKRIAMRMVIIGNAFRQPFNPGKRKAPAFSIRHKHMERRGIENLVAGD